MSESINPMKLVKVLDSRLSAGRIDQYTVYQGASEITYRSFPSSNLSSSNITFNNINPPDKTFVDRTVYLKMQYRATFTGTCPAGQNLLDQWGYDIGLRNLVVNNSFKNVTLTLNNANFTQDTNDILPAFSRVHFDKLKSYLSQSTSMPDNCQLYSEGVASNANVLASTQNGPPNTPPARGGFEGVAIETNTPTSATILITATEPIILSPLNYDDTTGTSKGFYNVSNLVFNATFDDQLAARIISIANSSTATITALSAVPVSGTIYFGYYSAQLIQNIPEEFSYPWYNVSRFIQTGQALAPEASATLTMNNITLSSIPKKIYLYIKPTRASYSAYQTDTFCRINTVSCQFGNRSSLLGNADANQLYSISKRNGVDADWSGWHGSLGSNLRTRNFSGCGSVLCLNPAKDLGLQELWTSGSTANLLLQFTINYTSLMPITGPTLAYDAYVITIYDGLITIPRQGICVQQDNVVGPRDVVNANMIEESFTTKEILDYSGGGFFSDIKDFWSRNKHWIMPVAKVASTGVKMAFPETAPILGALGLGKMCRMCRTKCGGQCGGGPSGGGLVGGAYSGGGLVGGAKMSKKKLLQLMQ